MAYPEELLEGSIAVDDSLEYEFVHNEMLVGVLMDDV
jgi:hypothetical protein